MSATVKLSGVVVIVMISLNGGSFWEREPLEQYSIICIGVEKSDIENVKIVNKKLHKKWY